jgi:hypothetical protein
MQQHTQQQQQHSTVDPSSLSSNPAGVQTHAISKEHSRQQASSGSSSRPGSASHVSARGEMTSALNERVEVSREAATAACDPRWSRLVQLMCHTGTDVHIHIVYMRLQQVLQQKSDTRLHMLIFHAKQLSGHATLVCYYPSVFHLLTVLPPPPPLLLLLLLCCLRNL